MTAISARRAAKPALIFCYLAIAVGLAAPQDFVSNGQNGKRLLLVAANLNQEYANSDSVIIYAVSPEGNLAQPFTVLQGENSALGKYDWTLVGVYSIHEIGSYLLIEFPRLNPRSSIFVSKRNPRKTETVTFNPENFIAEQLSHELMEGADGTVCDLWPISVQAVGTEWPVDANGLVVIPRTTLRSACKRNGTAPFLEKDNWSDFKNFRFDGEMRTGEVSLLTDQDGELVRKFSFNKEDPVIDLFKMPPGFGASPRRGAELSPRECFDKFGSVACTGGRGVNLEAADGKHLIISINDDRWKIGQTTGPDHNRDVFFRSSETGQWKQLPVLPVATTANDKMHYRLFEDWLVTSASAALLKADNITETIVPDVLTIMETGRQRNDLGVDVKPRTAPDVATLPARRITLWNLADGRRIDLAIPENDSEVVHIFDGHQVLLRIHDKLFFAETRGSKLADYKLATFDSVIPMVHWAFYSAEK